MAIAEFKNRTVSLARTALWVSFDSSLEAIALLPVLRALAVSAKRAAPRFTSPSHFVRVVMSEAGSGTIRSWA